MTTLPEPDEETMTTDEHAHARDEEMFGPQDSDPQEATPVEQWFRNGRAGL